MKTLASLRQSGRDRRARAAAGVNVPPEPTGVAPNQKLELNALAAALTGGATQSTSAAFDRDTPRPIRRSRSAWC